MLTRLDQYLYLTGTSSAQFARLVGVSKQTVDNWRYGKHSFGARKSTVKQAIERRNIDLQIAIRLSEEI